MPFNEESFNKYEQDLESANDHYYQNQAESSNEKKKKKIKQNKRTKKTLNEQQAEPNHQFQSSSNLSNADAYAPSSTASSNRELILSRQEKQGLSHLILFVSSIFQLSSFVAIVITFIFPFWMVFQIDIPGNFSTLNITNSKNLVFLSLSSTSVNTNQIMFNLGIWEVKMNTDKLQLIDLKTGVQTTNSQSLLWLNSDSSISFQAFLVNFLSFIEISSANIFTIQILEILHLIFTFLTFCSTSFTLCLCSKNRTSICWYLVCYFLCLVSFLTGLAVIIIIIVWQTSSLPSLVGTQAFLMSKSFNWCFWTAVGINSSLFSASFLIFCYILIGSILNYNKHKRVYEKKTTVSQNNTNKNKKGASILKNPNLTTADMTQNNDYSNAKLPRLQTNILPSSAALMSNSNPLLASNSTTAFSNLQTLTNSNANNSKNNNPSYTFYTGYGQYHKQNIRLNPIGDDNSLEKSFRSQSQNDHFNNYPMVITSSSNHKPNPILSPDHAYSNVFDQMNHDFRYQSYH